LELSGAILFAMSRSGIPDFDTPKKARIKGAADFNDAHYIPYSYNDLFKFYGALKQRGWEILKQDNELFDCRFNNNEGVTETRGAPRILSPKDIDRCDRFL
jgi:hypothetical protein